MSMRRNELSSAVFALGVAALATGALLCGGALVAACGEDTAAADVEDASALEAGRRDGGRTATDAAAGEADGGVTLPTDEASCAKLRAYRETCGEELECGTDAFDAWCLANTRSADSEAYRAALLACATPQNCTPNDRKHCMYQHYAKATQSAAQEALTKAFCETCQPGAVATCVSKTTSYTSGLGPTSVTSEFIAVWELSDAVADQLRTNCTGAKLDGGADAGACAAAFDRCAGDYYVDALVDCPK